jgi:excisionase family DNA binding protein
MKAVADKGQPDADERVDSAVVQPRGDDPVASRVNRQRRSGSRVERLLTVAEAAQWVDCCEETIRRAHLARQLDVLRFGARRVRIRPAALIAWLERGRQNDGSVTEGRLWQFASSARRRAARQAHDATTHGGST